VVRISSRPDPRSGQRLRSERLVELEYVKLAALSFSRSVSLTTAGIGPRPSPSATPGWVAEDAAIA